jgi:transposase-like protein
MTLNGCGVRDIARVLHISPTTVIQELKKTHSPQASEPKTSTAAKT